MQAVGQWLSARRARPWLRRHYARIGLLVASAAYFTFALVSAPRAEAVALKFSIFPGLEGGTLNEYGWHFDEIGYSWFGARDFTPGPGRLVKIRAEAWDDIGNWYRFRWWKAGTCRVYAIAQVWYNNDFHDVGGFNLHYLHVKPLGNGGYSSFFRYRYEEGRADIATVGDPDTDGCNENYSAHLHHSADIGMPYYYRLFLPSETCWINEAIHNGQCSNRGKVWQKHKNCYAWEGYDYKSGSYAQYAGCGGNSWNWRQRSSGTALVDAKW